MKDCEPTWLEILKFGWPVILACGVVTVTMYILGVSAVLFPLAGYGIGYLGGRLRIMQLEARDKRIKELHGN